MAPESTQARDDWKEIKADIKQLIKELRSLAPQPQPQREPERVKSKVSPILWPDFENSWLTPIQMQRGFLESPTEQGEAWFDRWLAEFQPTPPKLQNLVDVLLSMFIRGNTPLDMKIAAQLPSFADKLTLRLSMPPDGVKEVTPGITSPESAAKLREHVSSPTLWSLQVNIDAFSGSNFWWSWLVPSPDGEFRRLYVRAVDDEIDWKEPFVSDPEEILEFANDPEWPTVTRGLGGLWYSRSMSSLS